jgi:hypothetical protein
VSCTCYVAHGVEHLCEFHVGCIPVRAESCVPAGKCRVCACDEIEKLEARLSKEKSRLWMAELPKHYEAARVKDLNEPDPPASSNKPPWA